MQNDLRERLRDEDLSLVVINTLEANISYIQIENSFSKCILLYMHLSLLGAGSHIGGILYLVIHQTFFFNFFWPFNNLFVSQVISEST